jgi:hypothetical protein
VKVALSLFLKEGLMSISEIVSQGRELVQDLGQSAYNHLTASVPASDAKVSWNAKVLEVVVETLSSEDLHEQSFNELMDVMNVVIPADCRRIAENEGHSEEALADYSERALNLVQQANAPFRNLATCIAYDTDGLNVTSLLEVATEEGTSWGKLKSYASSVVDSLEYDESRHLRTVHYDVEGVTFSFTVGDCIAPREQIASLEAQVSALKAEWSPQFKAVSRDFKAENADLMQDRRTKADRERVDRKIADTLFQGLSESERETLRTEHATR